MKKSFLVGLCLIALVGYSVGDSAPQITDCRTNPPIINQGDFFNCSANITNMTYPLTDFQVKIFDLSDGHLYSNTQTAINGTNTMILNSTDMWYLYHAGHSYRPICYVYDTLGNSNTSVGGYISFIPSTTTTTTITTTTTSTTTSTTSTTCPKHKKKLCWKLKEGVTDYYV